MALLRLDREGGDQARLESFERALLAGLLAIAVGAIVEAGERLVDLGNQLALTVAGAQLDRPVGFRGGAVGEIGMVLILILEMLQRLLRLLEDVFFPVEQLLAEVFPLALAHERLFVGWPIALFLLTQHPLAVLPPCRALLLVGGLLRTHRFPVTRLTRTPCSRRAYIGTVGWRQ